MADRGIDDKKFDHLYDNYMKLSDGCIYCGDFAETRDHVPPISWVDSIDIEVYRKDFVFLKVPACKHCNNSLSNNMLSTINERKKFMHNKLKGHKFNRMPNWDHEELMEMSPMMRKSIKASMDIKELTQNRMVHALNYLDDDPTKVNTLNKVDAFPKTLSVMEKITSISLTPEEEALIDYIETLYKMFEANFRWNETKVLTSSVNKIKNNKLSATYKSNLTNHRDKLEDLWFDMVN